MTDIMEQHAHRLATLPTRDERGALMRRFRTQFGDGVAYKLRDRALAIRRQMKAGERLFSNLPPAARASDPSSSQAAGAEVTSTGRRDAQMRLAANAVALYPGQTTREYVTEGLVAGIDTVHDLGRRMSDAVNQGLVVRGPTRLCRYGQRRASTFHPPEQD